MSAKQAMKRKRAQERKIQERKKAENQEENNPTRYGIGQRKLEEQERRKNMFLPKAHKNAPAEMKSNKPVRRFRDHNIDHSLTKKTAVDPRFSDASGKVSDKHFYHNYEFLNQYQEDEIKAI